MHEADEGRNRNGFCRRHFMLVRYLLENSREEGREKEKSQKRLRNGNLPMSINFDRFSAILGVGKGGSKRLVSPLSR